MLLENRYPSSICSIEDKVIEAKEMEAGLSPGNFEFHQIPELKFKRTYFNQRKTKNLTKNIPFSMISFLRALTAMIF